MIADLPDDAAALARIDALSTRAESPCGKGSLVWRLWGPSSGPAVLLLHGGSGTWAHWIRNIEPLAAAGFRVIAPDMPGFGGSSAPPDGEDADVLPGWLDRGLQAVWGDAPLQVVGFSLGGLVAGLWAAGRPERFVRVVLVGAPALSAERLAPLDLRDWRTATDDAARRVAHRHNLLILMLHADASVNDLALAVHAEGVASDRMRRRRMMLTDALARTLPSLSCAVAGIWGEHDVLYAHRRPLVAQVLATAPGFESMTWIADAGHWVAYERAGRFNDALIDLLRRPARRTRADA